MITCSNTPTHSVKATITKSKIWDICFSPSGSKEQLRPWITISKHQLELKLHLMPGTLFIGYIL
ncbi:hypothetical protein B5S50_19850 [Clostridium sp. 001]|nr:hypothetical protein B5S50_19850 [Clostridium sp. 001]